MYNEHIYLKFNRSHMILVSKYIYDYINNLSISPYNLYQIIHFDMKFNDIFIKFDYNNITNIEINTSLGETQFFTYIYKNIYHKFKNIKYLTINFNNDNEIIIEKWPKKLNTLSLLGKPNNTLNYPSLPKKLKYLKLSKIFIEKNIYSSLNLVKNKYVNNDNISHNVLHNIQEDDINIFQDNEIKNIIWLSNVDYVPIINNIIKEKISLNLNNLIITYLFY